MGIFKPIETCKDNIDNIEVKAGQMISCSDTGELYFDTIHNGRKAISDLIMVESDSVREGLTNPIPNKLYLVLDTKFIWMYNGLEWNQLTFPKPEIFMHTKYDEIIANRISEDGYVRIEENDYDLDYLQYDADTDLVEIYINGILYPAVNNLEKRDDGYYINFNEDMSSYTSYCTLTYKIYKNFNIQNINATLI